MDVTVSAIGDADSLMGGTLIMTPLSAADGDVYAVAQGSVIAGGIAAKAENAAVIQGVPTAGSIPSGARVEREVNFDFSTLRNIRLALKQPDFTTASRIERAVNGSGVGRIAEMVDAGTVVLDLSGSADVNPARLKALSHFFEHYKDLEEGKWVKVLGWEGIEEAHKEILGGLENYRSALAAKAAV